MFRHSLRFGLSSFPEDGREPGAPVQGADSALYAAKRDGRNVLRTQG